MSFIRSLGSLVLVVHTFLSCTPAPQARPQFSIERSGEAYPALPAKVKVKLYFGGEPQESYREIGRITATCPMKHWINGQYKRGRPLCVKGLRLGARKLGAQGVVDIKTKRFRPSWEPDSPWLIMKGVAVRLR